MNCPNCSKELNANAKFCKYCGTKIGNVKDKKVNSNKGNVIKNLLLIVFAFLTISQAVFLFMYFTLSHNVNNNVINEKPKDEPSSIEEKIASTEVNFNYKKIKLNDNIKYEIYKGKLILEKSGEWGALLVPTASTYTYVSKDIDGQKNSFINNYSYQVNNQGKKLVSKTELVVFEVVQAGTNGIIAYYEWDKDMALGIEIYAQENVDNLAALEEVVKMLEESTSYEEINSVRESRMLSNKMQR